MYGLGPANATSRIKGRVATTDNASHLLLTAPGPGYTNWISQLTISNKSAVDTQVQILSGSTIIWTAPAPSHGGSIIMFPDPINGNDGDAINCQADDAATTISISAAGYKANT